MNVGFDNKTINFALKKLDYKPTYISTTLAKLVKIKYLSEPSTNIFMMEKENFMKIHFANPNLALEIMNQWSLSK